MAKHPAGPFTVLISEYRIVPFVDTGDHGAVFQSRHQSAHAAARKLAGIIAGRSKLAKDVCRCISRDFAGQYLIVCGDGSKHALVPFRAAFCAKA